MTVLKTNQLVSLLHGVTDSGKTEIFMHLTRHYLKLNKQVLILVPEIALTPQMLEIVSKRFEKLVFIVQILINKKNIIV